MLTFCQLVHLVCFILAVVLLVVALFGPAWAAKIRLMEAIIGTAVVAWLCVGF